MARKHRTQIESVGGMSIKDIMNIDIDRFNKMNEKELKMITSRLVSASNKRIRRLEEKGIKSPAYRSLGTDVRFSVKLPKTADVTQRVNKLRNEFSRARNFLSMKTSTLKGYNDYQESVKEDIEKATGKTLGKGDVSRVYQMLHKLQERGDAPSNATGKKGGSKGSLIAREIVVNMMLDENLSEDKMFEKFEKEFDRYITEPDEYEYEDETEESDIDI